VVGFDRTSGSFVRFPVNTTRLMFMLEAPFQSALKACGRV
jgi:hypothetical protein